MQLVVLALGGQCKPGQAQRFVPADAIAAQVQQPQVEHGPFVAPGGGFLVHRARPGRVAGLQGLVGRAEVIVAGQVALGALRADDPADIGEMALPRLRGGRWRGREQEDAGQ